MRDADLNPVDKFGQLITTNLRDSAIDKADALLAAKLAAPTLKKLQSELSRLSPEQKLLVRRCVVEDIDTGIHAFLFALGRAHDFDMGITVAVDGENVAAMSDGLHGEEFGKGGWYARFSKHGLHPDPA